MTTDAIDWNILCNKYWTGPKQHLHSYLFLKDFFPSMSLKVCSSELQKLQKTQIEMTTAIKNTNTI